MLLTTFSSIGAPHPSVHLFGNPCQGKAHLSALPCAFMVLNHKRSVHRFFTYDFCPCLYNMDTTKS